MHQDGNMTLEYCLPSYFGGNIMRTLPRGMTLLLFGAALMGCLTNSTNSNRPSNDKPGDEDKAALDISGVDADGKLFQLGDYRGKVVLLDFWFSQ